MKTYLTRIVFVGACVFAVSIVAHGQRQRQESRTDRGSTATSVLSGTGKTAVIIVGSAAKVAYETTKFVAKDVAAPVAGAVIKPVIVHSAPAAAKFVIKNSAKYLLPFVLKLSVL